MLIKGNKCHDSVPSAAQAEQASDVGQDVLLT